MDNDNEVATVQRSTSESSSDNASYHKTGRLLLPIPAASFETTPATINIPPSNMSTTHAERHRTCTSKLAKLLPFLEHSHQVRAISIQCISASRAWEDQL